MLTTSADFAALISGPQSLELLESDGSCRVTEQRERLATVLECLGDFALGFEIALPAISSTVTRPSS